MISKYSWKKKLIQGGLAKEVEALCFARAFWKLIIKYKKNSEIVLKMRHITKEHITGLHYSRPMKVHVNA